MKILFLLIGAAALSVSGLAMAKTDEFATAMNVAMARMHNAMMARHTNDPDRDFARMMIPHHQGAIDMAKIELRYGKDERLRRLAEGIIVEQHQEVAVMQGILSTPAALSPRKFPEPSGRNHTGVHP